MLLSDEGLDNLYEVQPIYFWDTFNRSLVPDLRYINRSLSPANRLVQLASWLRDGPSESLRPAVNPLPAAIEIKDRPVLDGAPGAARINLSAKAASVQGQLAKLVVQLRWSLRSLASAVELQIEGQRQDLGREAAWDNPAAAPDGQKEPPRFAVIEGRVRQLAGDPVVVPALASEDNTGVVSAAILRGPVQHVALVREDAPGALRLWLGSYNQGAKVAQYVPTELAADTMSRPVGLTTPVSGDPAFLVAAAGRLFAVSVVSKQAVDRTPPGVSGVTAVSVAPDGRRIALIASGLVYAGVLTFEGSVPSVAQLEEVQTTLSEAVGVAWSREEWLVVAGRSAGQSALVEVTVDSALIEQMSMRNLSGLTVARVVADPSVRRDDSSRGERGPIMIEANGRAYRVFSGSVEEYTLPEPSAAPSPSPSGSSAKQPMSSAPFFLD
nr:LpqB family beta-propeller domain-containing protein [Planosporangium flavigriseum]